MKVNKSFRLAFAALTSEEDFARLKGEFFLPSKE
jgi:hypothetical protein